MRGRGALLAAGRSAARRLDGSGATTLDVGGKAASLDRLVANGFPVPPAIALTADAYRAFVEGAALGAFIDELRRADLPSADAIEAETARVDAAFLGAGIPADLADIIRDTARELLAGAPVAVRSSATAEDLAAASFAGQYRTFLDLRSEDEVLDAVVRCWASLWGPSVRAYRRREGVSESGLAMGVIVQAMAPAEWAGVVFTRDPHGDPRTARIEAVRGLGEGLVSGRITPHDYEVDRTTFSVRGSHAHWPPTFLEDLLRLGLRIERATGAPQDIEWAFANGRLLVLQTRPITVTEPRVDEDDGFDTTPIQGATYTPAGVQEMLPGVVSPLLWTINAPLLENAFRNLFAELGARIPLTDGPYVAVGRFRGRAALNLSLIRDAAASVPGSSRSEVERQYLGRVLDRDDDLSTSKGGLSQVVSGLRSVRTRRRISDEVEVFAESVHGVVALDLALAELPLARLVAYRGRVRDLAYRGYAAEVAAAAAAAAAYRSLESLLERWAGEERATSWAQRLTAATGATDLDQRLIGSMSIYGGPTWDEDVVLPTRGVRSVTRSGIPRLRTPSEHFSDEAERRALAELVAELQLSRRWRAIRVLTGQIVDVRVRLLRKLTDDASRFLMLREKAKAALLVLGGEERRLICEATRRLLASGSLSQAEDVLLLSDGELEELLLGGEPVSAEELVRRRNAFSRAEAAEPLPETFVGLPGADANVPALTGDVLEGWAASPGRNRGQARILHGVADGRHLLPGEIIVARTTDPSWTPLFSVAGGIVLEEGGPLSHAAIVAREFRVPAVLNVKGALRAISDGQEVEVDGSTGLVVRARAEVAA
jgi:rifampicin phosphotransferase